MTMIKFLGGGGTLFVKKDSIIRFLFTLIRNITCNVVYQILALILFLKNITGRPSKPYLVIVHYIFEIDIV